MFSYTAPRNIFIVVVNLICCLRLSFSIDPLVLINQGLVRGQHANDGNYSYFLGIPYAQVDLENPFGPSLPAPIFEDDIFDANKISIKCPQANATFMTLDCLTLNIYIPTSASTKNLLPVYVWIHGGGFDSGCADDGGASNLWKYDILLVKINYRLGPYGFMCLDSPHVPGNQGLKDQHEALQWIKTNIAAFGGDPNDITIGGLSAGSCSAILHLYSSKEKLFNKVISQSGVPQVDGMFANRDVYAAIKLANILGLNTDDTNAALVFLSQLPIDMVVEAFLKSGFRFLPCKENTFKDVEYFIKDGPYLMSNREKVHNTAILIGHATKELSLNYGEDDILEIYYNKIKRNFDLNEEQLLKIVETIQHFYIGDSLTSLNASLKAEEFDSDITFNHPIQRTITKLLNEDAGPIYEYMFSYLEEPEDTGALHGSDMKYFFPAMLENQPNYSKDDQLISDRITELWANFIKYGNPTPEISNLVPVAWVPVSKDLRPYLVIDKEMRLPQGVFSDRMAFWDLFYSAYENYSYLAWDDGTIRFNKPCKST